MQKKKVVFHTGGRGFIGKNIIEKLSDKYIFLSPSHAELDLLDEDKTRSFFKNHKIDVVIHAAMVGGSRKEEFVGGMLQDNLKMFFSIIRNRDYFKKMIHLGSGAEYDKSRPIVKVNESDFDERIPSDEYGFSKYICSKYIEQVDNIVNLRIFGMYGKYEDYRYRFISNAICRNLVGLPIIMQQNVIFDYVFIDDFVKIVEYFIENETRDKFYNIGTGKSIDLLTIAKMINKVADKPSEIIVNTTGFNNEYTCDNTQLCGEIKNIHFTALEDAIQQMYDWYKSIKPSILQETL